MYLCFNKREINQPFEIHKDMKAIINVNPSSAYAHLNGQEFEATQLANGSISINVQNKYGIIVTVDFGKSEYIPVQNLISQQKLKTLKTKRQQFSQVVEKQIAIKGQFGHGNTAVKTSETLTLYKCNDSRFKVTFGGTIEYFGFDKAEAEKCYKWFAE